MYVRSPEELTQEIQAASAAGRYAEVVRLARIGSGLTQRELGQRTGYSAASISRFETGARPLTDIAVLQALATALDLPFSLLGLRDATIRTGVNTAPVRARATTLDRTRSTTGGDDGPMLRREVLAGLTVLTGSLVVPGELAAPGPLLPGRAAAGVSDGDGDARAVAQLERLLTDPAPRPLPVSIAGLERTVDAATAAFAACRYGQLAGWLPEIAAAAHAGLAATPQGGRRRPATVLARCYLLGSELSVKFNQDGMAWVIADRGLRAATESGDPRLVAAASRRVAIAMRRHGRHDGATSLLIRTAQSVDADRDGPAAGRNTDYARLLCTAAYSSAQAGRRGEALELVDEALSVASLAAAARRPATRATTSPARLAACSPAHVAVYSIGVHLALGDPARALAHARTVDPRRLPTPERRARFQLDTARAWQRFGRPHESYAALRAIELTAPEEIRRPSVRTLIRSLLDTRGRAPAGLPALASRAGVTGPV